jgi:hypothetical protein
MRPLDFRKTVEGLGGDVRAIVVERTGSVGRSASLRRRGLRIGRIIGSRNYGRMLEQARRISVVRGERGIRGKRKDER